MCACETDFTCSKCSSTPNDPRYLEDERPELEDEPFVRELERCAVT
jgi:hypothetical protein